MAFYNFSVNLECLPGRVTPTVPPLNFGLNNEVTAYTPLGLRLHHSHSQRATCAHLPPHKVTGCYYLREFERDKLRAQHSLDLVDFSYFFSKLGIYRKMNNNPKKNKNKKKIKVLRELSGTLKVLWCSWSFFPVYFLWKHKTKLYSQTLSEVTISSRHTTVGAQGLGLASLQRRDAGTTHWTSYCQKKWILII